MNDCIHKNENNICEIYNVVCDLDYKEIKEGDCDDYESNYTEEDWQDLLYHMEKEG